MCVCVCVVVRGKKEGFGGPFKKKEHYSLTFCTDSGSRLSRSTTILSVSISSLLVTDGAITTQHTIILAPATTIPFPNTDPNNTPNPIGQKQCYGTEKKKNHVKNMIYKLHYTTQPISSSRTLYNIGNIFAAFGLGLREEEFLSLAAQKHVLFLGHSTNTQISSRRPRIN